jgi:hypothetical protein
MSGAIGRRVVGGRLWRSSRAGVDGGMQQLLYQRAPGSYGIGWVDPRYLCGKC